MAHSDHPGPVAVSTDAGLRAAWSQRAVPLRSPNPIPAPDSWWRADRAVRTTSSCSVLIKWGARMPRVGRLSRPRPPQLSPGQRGPGLGWGRRSTCPQLCRRDGHARRAGPASVSGWPLHSDQRAERGGVGFV